MNALLSPRVVPTRRRRRRVGIFQRLFAAAVLFLSTGGLLPLLRMESGVTIDDLEGDQVMQITWLAVYAITLVLLATRAKETVQLLYRERWLAVLCGLAGVSMLWSVAPDVTLRRTVALFGTTAFGVYLASRYTVHELLRIVSWVLSATVVLSVFLAVFVPTYGVSPEDGAWRGIFAHKNPLGRAMALACLALVFRIRQGSMAKRLMTLCVLAMACVALLGSHSVAGLLTALAVVVTTPLWPILRLRNTLLVAATVFGVMAIGGIAIWLSTASEVVVTALGKDPTLTGRAGLWLQVVDAIANRPWLGHGYSAFWLGFDGESASIWSALPWRPPHAHNGILDLGLELGVAGLALFVIGFAMAVYRATTVIRWTSSVYGLWPIAYLLFVVMANVAESTIMVRNSMFWMLYVVICVWLVRPRDNERRVPA